MHRRELFRILGAGAVVPALAPNVLAANVLAPDVLAMLREAQATPSRAPKTLSPKQDELVTTMAELIIPQTSTPGAKGARVNEFIDVILTDWATEDERKAFLAGLQGVDDNCTQLYGKTFLECTPAQQESLLRALDEVWVAEEYLPKPHMTGYQRRDQQLQGNFFGVFKRLTLHGYYTSEVGFTKELKLEIIPGAFHGCVPLDASKT
jgi:hypothetical protein